MADLTTRAGKGEPLTNNELDANFTNLNADVATRATKTELQTHIGDSTNPHATTAVQVGAIPATEKSAANGVAPLDENTKIPAAFLPSYVDDVLEFADFDSFPEIGESGKIYVDLSNNHTFRWSGSAYVEIAASPGSTDAVTEGATNKYFTYERVRETVLIGLSVATATAVSAMDSVLGGIGKLQAQITGLITDVSGKLTAANNLSDLPSKTTSRTNLLPSMTGQAKKVLAVNAAEDDVEYTTSSATVISDTKPANPEAGWKWLDTTSGIEYTYVVIGETAQWVESAAVMNAYSTIQSVEIIATEGQDTFAVTYTPGFIKVYMNGYRLYDSDFVATSGTTVVLNTAAKQGDKLKFEIVGTFAIANAVDLNSNQAVSGVKTFTTSPIVPTPSAPTDAANMGWVEGVVSGGITPTSVTTATITAPASSPLTSTAGTKTMVLDPVTGLSVNGKPVPVLVDSYTSATSWYRVYSDGFIEQGMVISAPVTGAFTLPYRYTTVNYGVWHDHFYGDRLNDSVRTIAISLTGFSLAGGTGAGTMYIYSRGR